MGHRFLDHTADIAVALEAPSLGELYAEEVEGLLFRRAEVLVEEVAGEGVRLWAEAFGEERDEARHPIKVLIKAVTYHALEVGPAVGGRFRARVVFDI